MSVTVVHAIPESEFLGATYTPPKPTRKARKNFKVTVLPDGVAQGVGFGRRAFRGKGSPIGAKKGGFMRGDRVFTSEESVWLSAGADGEHLGVKTNRAASITARSGAELRTLAAAGDSRATAEIARRKAKRIVRASR